jgi:hypothetical protein
MDVNAIDLVGAEPTTWSTSRSRPPTTSNGCCARQPVNWGREPDLSRMLAFLETKTVWHPVGV